MAGNASDTKTQLFLQSVKVGGQEIPRSMMLTCLYIEHCGLTAPQLKIEYKDSTNWIINQLGVKHGSILTVTLGDPNGNGQTQWSDTFFVVKAPAKGDVVTLYAFSESVRLLKVPAVSAQFFVKKQPMTIVQALAKGLDVAADTFTKQGTYHLNVGQKPSAVLQEIARDDGAVVWVARGSIYFRSMAKLAAARPKLTYTANNPTSDGLTITRWRVINNDDQYLKDHQFRFMGYDLEGGLITAGSPKNPVKWVAAQDKIVLSNMCKTLLPKFEMECEGNGALTPGVTVKCLVNSYSTDSGLDESVPQQMIVSKVAHYEDRYTFTSKAELAVVYNGDKSN